MILPEGSAHLLQGANVAKEFLVVRQAFSGVGRGLVLLPKVSVPVEYGSEVLVCFVPIELRAVFVAQDLLCSVVLKAVFVALGFCCLVALRAVALGL